MQRKLFGLLMLLATVAQASTVNINLTNFVEGVSFPSNTVIRIRLDRVSANGPWVQTGRPQQMAAPYGILSTNLGGGKYWFSVTEPSLGWELPFWVPGTGTNDISSLLTNGVDTVASRMPFVTQIVAGTNITISPSDGKGAVTVSASVGSVSNGIMGQITASTNTLWQSTTNFVGSASNGLMAQIAASTNGIVSQVTNALPALSVTNLSVRGAMSITDMFLNFLTATNLAENFIASGTNVAPGIISTNHMTAEAYEAFIGGGSTTTNYATMHAETFSFEEMDAEVIDGTNLITGSLGTNVFTADALASLGSKTIFSRPTKVVMFGDSLTDNNAPWSWAYWATNLYELKNLVEWDIQAVSGSHLSNVWDRIIYAQTNKPSASQDGLAVVMVGANDITHGEANDLGAATNYADSLEVFYQALRTNGWKVCALTILPSTLWQNASERLTSCQWYLNQRIASSTNIDFLVRSDLVLPNAADTDLFYDGTHTTNRGSILLANAVYAALSDPKDTAMPRTSKEWGYALGPDVALLGPNFSVGTNLTVRPTHTIISAGTPETFFASNGAVKLSGTALTLDIHGTAGIPNDVGGILRLSDYYYPKEKLLFGLNGDETPVYGWIQAWETDAGPRVLALNQRGGNVGICTNNPQSALHVHGDAQASSFTLGGSTITEWPAGTFNPEISYNWGPQNFSEITATNFYFYNGTNLIAGTNLDASALGLITNAAITHASAATNDYAGILTNMPLVWSAAQTFANNVTVAGTATLQNGVNVNGDVVSDSTIVAQAFDGSDTGLTNAAGTTLATRFANGTNHTTVSTNTLWQSTTNLMGSASNGVRSDILNNLPVNAIYTAGVVSAPGTAANKVWKTDVSGNPAWRDDAAGEGGGITMADVRNQGMVTNNNAGPVTLLSSLSLTEDGGHLLVAGNQTNSGQYLTVEGVMNVSDVKSSGAFDGEIHGSTVYATNLRPAKIHGAGIVFNTNLASEVSTLMSDWGASHASAATNSYAGIITNKTIAWSASQTFANNVTVAGAVTLQNGANVNGDIVTDSTLYAAGIEADGGGITNLNLTGVTNHVWKVGGETTNHVAKIGTEVTNEVARAKTLIGFTTNILTSLNVDMAVGYTVTNLGANITIAGVANRSDTETRHAVLVFTANGADRSVTLPTGMLTDGTGVYWVTNGGWATLSVSTIGKFCTNAVFKSWWR